MAHTKTLLAVFVAALCAAHGPSLAQQLTPPRERATDGAIHRDNESYAAVQGRIKALNDKGVRVASYGLAKAQCWLDVSLHEYSRNDRSAFPQEAMNESVKLIQTMEASRPVGLDTPLVNKSAKLRPDLWDAAAALKTHPGWRCAEQLTACAEVELVHAGNEFNQQQWRHAKPYVQIAEDLIGEAQRAAQACIPPPPPPAPPPPPPVVIAPPPLPLPPRAVPPPPVPVTIAANVLFNFDKRDMPNVRAYTKDQLDALIARVKSGTVNVGKIDLIGHADRLNSTGKADYNEVLSKDRVNTIREYMVSNGVAVSLIATSYRADAVQIEACQQQKFRSNVELQECLLPNRRVEVVVTGTAK